MTGGYPHAILDDPETLAQLDGWSAEVYHDLRAVQRGKMSHAAFDEKYLHRKAILCLDMTGFTETCISGSQIQGLLRIYDAQRVCMPVLMDHGSSLVRAFADDLVAMFDKPGVALDAAFTIHERIAVFNESKLSSDSPTECCIGIGYGDVYAIGPNLAMGDEMNRSAKLGEDIARGRETLVTESVYEALQQRDDIEFERLSHDDLMFPYYRAEPKR